MNKNKHSLFKLIGQHFVRGTVFFNASALSYYTILSLIPFLLVVFSLISVMHNFGNIDFIENKISTFIIENLSLASGPKVANMIQTFIQNIQIGKIGIIGMAFLLVTLLGLLTNIEKAFNETWQVAKSRSYVKRFLAFWTVGTLGTFLLMLSFTFGLKIKNLYKVQGKYSVIPLLLLRTSGLGQHSH